MRKTCMERYGSETYLGSDKAKAERLEPKTAEQIESWKKKVRATCMERYGTEYPQRIAAVREKIRTSNIAKSRENLEKGKRTKLARRNGRFWTDEELARISEKNRTPENQAKRLERAKARRIRNFNGPIRGNAFVKPLFSLEEFMSASPKRLQTQDLPWRCVACGLEFARPIRTFYVDGIRDLQHKAYARCPRCFPDLRSSFEEKQVAEYIEKRIPTGYEIMHGTFENYRIIPPYQLDIAVRRVSDGKIVFAVEFDGLKWHGIDAGINKQLNKTVMCEKIGMPLLHVFEDDWLSGAAGKTLDAYARMEFAPDGRYGETAEIDRARFSKAIGLPGYELVDEKPPEVIKRVIDGKTYLVPDCGTLIYRKIG